MKHIPILLAVLSIAATLPPSPPGYTPKQAELQIRKARTVAPLVGPPLPPGFKVVVSKPKPAPQPPALKWLRLGSDSHEVLTNLLAAKIRSAGFVPASSQYHSAGAFAGGPVGAAVNWEVTVSALYLNADDFGCNHQWTSAVFERAHFGGVETGGNAIRPGATVIIAPYPFTGPTQTVTLADSMVTIPPGHFAQVSETFTIPASDAALTRLIVSGTVMGVDTQDAVGGSPTQTGGILQHGVSILPTDVLAGRRDGGDIVVSFNQPHNVARTLLTSESVTGPWQTAETFPALPAGPRERRYPILSPLRLFKLAP